MTLCQGAGASAPSRVCGFNEGHCYSVRLKKQTFLVVSTTKEARLEIDHSHFSTRLSQQQGDQNISVLDSPPVLSRLSDILFKKKKNREGHLCTLEQRHA